MGGICVGGGVKSQFEVDGERSGVKSWLFAEGSIKLSKSGSNDLSSGIRISNEWPTSRVNSGPALNELNINPFGIALLS